MRMPEVKSVYKDCRHCMNAVKNRKNGEVIGCRELHCNFISEENR